MNTDTQMPTQGPAAAATDLQPAQEVRAAGEQQAPQRSQVVTSQSWRHTYGEMLIETCADGTVWIDGKVVPDTLPSGQARPAKLA
jgi:hypothetical protein